MSTFEGEGREARKRLYSEIAAQAGVEEDVVVRVLDVLGIDRNFEEATKLLGSVPRLHDIRVVFKISPSTIMV